MNRVSMTLATLPLATILLAGCVTEGTGVAESPNSAVTGVFNWRAGGADRGDLTATLSNGRIYQGPFYQVTRESRIDSFGPLWTDWDPTDGPGWPVWGPDDAFITEYTGQVVANLAGPDGHMRCEFKLFRPSTGMSGGGFGRCQLPDRTIIRADFPAR